MNKEDVLNKMKELTFNNEIKWERNIEQHVRCFVFYTTRYKGIKFLIYDDGDFLCADPGHGWQSNRIELGNSAELFSFLENKKNKDMKDLKDIRFQKLFKNFFK